MTDINRLNFAKRTLLYLFLSVPIISATISAFHLEGFMRLGNPTFLSVTTAIAYEIANVTAMFIFVMLPRINRSFVWISFIMLVIMQVVGNVFFSYDYIIRNVNPEHLSSWYSMTNYLFDSSNKIESSFYLACFIGVPVPLVAIFLTKSVSNYLGGEEELEEKKTEITNKLPDYIHVDDTMKEEISAIDKLEEILEESLQKQNSAIQTENGRIYPPSYFKKAVDDLFKETDETETEHISSVEEDPISKWIEEKTIEEYLEKNKKIEEYPLPKSGMNAFFGKHEPIVDNPMEFERIGTVDEIKSSFLDQVENEIVVGKDTLIDIPTIDEEIAVETNKEELNNTSDFNNKLEQRGLIIK